MDLTPHTYFWSRKPYTSSVTSGATAMSFVSIVLELCLHAEESDRNPFIICPLRTYRTGTAQTESTVSTYAFLYPYLAVMPSRCRPRQRAPRTTVPRASSRIWQIWILILSLWLLVVRGMTDRQIKELRRVTFNDICTRRKSLTSDLKIRDKRDILPWLRQLHETCISRR